ncbi:MAG TPA: AMP-binding protein [Candidatus Binatia bacterium]|nr:AMP-binding protein [Candidatus Binatia bacterium]
MIATGFRTLIDALNAAPAQREFVTSWIDEDERETVSFGEFRRRAGGQAALLRKHGVLRGDRVVIIMPQDIAAMTAFMGAMMLGAVPAFLAYPNFKVEPAKYHSGLAGLTANLAARVVIIDADFPEDLLGHVALGEGAKLLRAAPETDVGDGKPADSGAEPADLAFLQHSAGTTGLQKGVALSHAAVLRQLQSLIEALQIDGSRDRIYSWLPLYHDMGLIACFMLPLVCHTPVVMQSPLAWVMQPQSMLQIMSEYRCTLAWLPNFTFQFVPRRTPRECWSEYDLSAARALINCSEPVRAASMDEFYRAFAPIGLRREALQSSYAMAENVFAVTQSGTNGRIAPARVWADSQRFRSEHRVFPVAQGTAGAIEFVSSGQLLPGNEVRIVSDSGETLPDGQVGEIRIRSSCLFDGYYNRPDLTAKAIVDGWYRSGDLGFYLEDELYVIGRKNDLLITGGENIYPQDIEEIAAGHPAIHDGRAVAMGLYNPDLGTEEIVLVAEVEREEMLENAAAIESELRSRIVGEAGLAVRNIFVKPPKWIVKSTAGKPARSATREKLLREHPELQREPMDDSRSATDG